MKLWYFAMFVLALTISYYAETSNAQSILVPSPGQLRSADALSLGSTLAHPNSLTLTSRVKMMRAASDRISGQAFHNYGSDFSKYWEVSKSSRSGKFFEALFVHEENQRLLKVGQDPRFILSAAEMGGKTHPADVVEIANNLRVTKQYQMKLGWNAAGKAVLVPKYAGMTVVTPCDQLKILQNELKKAEVKAARRGVELAPKWTEVRQALNEGRLVGYSKSRKIVEKLAERYNKMFLWRDATKLAREASVVRTASATAGAKASSVLGRTAGRGFFVIDVAAAGYQTYKDVRRYRDGEIGTGYLTAKSSLRGVQVGLGYYALVSPEPITKTLAGAAVIMLVVTDEVSDQMYRAKCAEARRLLDSLDRGEQYETAKRQLLRKIEAKM